MSQAPPNQRESSEASYPYCEFTVDARLYSNNAILSAIYWHLNKFHISVDIGTDDPTKSVIVVRPKNPVDYDSEALEYVRKEILNSIIDYQIRITIDEKTSSTRDEILKKAFSDLWK